VTLQRAGGAAAFSATAADYAATMAVALQPVAREVARLADLQPAESVLDAGTGTGNALPFLVGEGRRVVGVDAAPGMLALAARVAPSVELVEADFASLPFPSASFDVVIAVHALLFGEDRPAVLQEWRRVTAPGGRLALSVPGPGTVVPTAVLGDVYERFGLAWGDDYPTTGDLKRWAAAAGWTSIRVAADAATAIPLRDDEQFRAWLRVGARGRATGSWSSERREQFVRELMAAAPRDASGRYCLPFGTLYLTARNPHRHPRVKQLPYRSA
jgi:ubiquinone/menaquinone biosynthesis C-methylase UbiE